MPSMSCEDGSQGQPGSKEVKNTQALQVVGVNLSLPQRLRGNQLGSCKDAGPTDRTPTINKWIVSAEISNIGLLRRRDRSWQWWHAKRSLLVSSART